MKKIFVYLGVFAFLAVIVLNISISLKQNADLAMVLATSEALARGEEASITCSYKNCYYGPLCHTLDPYSDPGCPCKITGNPNDSCYYGK